MEQVHEHVNEHLSRGNKLLFRDARRAAREKQYKYVWVRGGKIFLRKDDRARVIHVSDADKISRL